ncbi:unnamed protein product [Lepeophtheirus salmonis]|uniref:Mitochondria-eating protein n=1 Tax=Lepeophtheirus salmonis TaxID=72036 RepID=A0A7R8CZM8_LEPSM|nr:unnamed protein product [Lepeophtheirus salmonis]CAF2951734.1 unnamed protein product [Lepeophtheirus salmonis]
MELVTVICIISILGVRGNGFYLSACFNLVPKRFKMHRMGSYFDSSCIGLPKKGILLSSPSGSKSSSHNSSSSSSNTSGNDPSKNRSSKGIKRPISRHLKFENDDMTLNKRLASLTIADMSPKLAYQRILLLYDKGDHREAASFIRRLSLPTFRSLLSDLPLDYFLESMPQSLPLLESIYSKIHITGSSQFKEGKFSPEIIVWQIIKFFAAQDESRGDFCGPWVSTCKRLLSVLLSTQPRIKRVVHERRKALTRAIEGLGQHGMVGTSDESLMNLHDALKVQFEKVQKTYGDALDKLTSLSLVPKSGSSSSTSPPVAQSHQRQLSLKAHEIQERLIKNKTLLNVVEPALGNHSLEVLLGILQRRIELDKEVLFQFTQLKKELLKLLGKGRSHNPGVAPLLMKFQRGCQQVLDLMKEVSEEEEYETSTSDYSGYHSDSDSAIMMSGNSPFVSKSARYNFLSRSGRYAQRTEASSSKESPSQSSSGISSGSSSHHDSDSNDEAAQRALSGKVVVPPTIVSIVCNETTRSTRKFKKEPLSKAGEVKILRRSSSSNNCRKCEKNEREDYDEEEDDVDAEALRKEAARLRLELEKTKKDTFCHAGTSMSSFLYRISSSSSRHSYDPEDHRAVILVRKYSDLFSTHRIQTLDSLNSLKELHSAEELKNKLLFSVVVLSFRSALSYLDRIRENVRKILQLPTPNVSMTNQVVLEMEYAVQTYLRKSHNTYDLGKSLEDVSAQIWATLYDYPCLKGSKGLQSYIESCIRVSWGLVNQIPKYDIDYEDRVFCSDLHVRHHTSSSHEETIKTYLWPALREGKNGPCVFKAVVIT